MILHTIISPADILYSPEMVNKKPEKNNAVCVTNIIVNIFRSGSNSAYILK